MKRRKTRENKGKIDRTFLYLCLLLTFLGLVALTDASVPQAMNAFGDKFYLAKQQILWAGVGLITLVAGMKIPYSLWGKLAVPLFIASILGLMVVLIPGIGSSFLGARRWLFLGPMSIQPSEFVKLTLIIYLAKAGSAGKSALALLLPVALVSGLIMLEPDLGTTIVVAATAFIMLFASGINLFYFAGAGILGLAASAVLIMTSAYRRARLATFFEQSNDPLGTSYHVKQVLLALGSGGLFGVGLGQSRQKYLFLPEAASDSIFSVIAEEVGFIGSAVLVFLLMLLILRGLKIAKNAPDAFGQLLGLGITSWLGAQVFFNISSMVVLTPLTGIPLPFFSYGGSSLVMVLFACGVLVNISKTVK